MVAMHSSRSNSQDSPRSVQSTENFQNSQCANIEKHDPATGSIHNTDCNTSCDANRDSIHSLGSADNGHTEIDYQEILENASPLGGRDYYDDYAYQYYNTYFVKNKDLASPQSLFSGYPFVSDTAMDEGDANVAADFCLASDRPVEAKEPSDDLPSEGLQMDVHPADAPTDVHHSDVEKCGGILDTCTPQSGMNDGEQTSQPSSRYSSPEGTQASQDDVTAPQSTTPSLLNEENRQKPQDRHVSIDVTDSPLENKIPSVYDLYSLDPRVCGSPLTSIGFRTSVNDHDGLATNGSHDEHNDHNDEHNDHNDEHNEHSIENILETHSGEKSVTPSSDGTALDDTGDESSGRQSTKHVHFSDEVVRIGECARSQEVRGTLPSSIRKTASPESSTYTSHFDAYSGVRSLLTRSFGFKRNLKRQKSGFQSKRGYLQPITSSPDSIGSPNSILLSSPEWTSRQNDGHNGQDGDRMVHHGHHSGDHNVEQSEGPLHEYVTADAMFGGTLNHSDLHGKDYDTPMEDGMNAHNDGHNDAKNDGPDDHYGHQDDHPSDQREETSMESIQDVHAEAPKEPFPEEIPHSDQPLDLPSLLNFFPTTEGNYKTLASITSNMEGIDLYVVVAEMMMNRVNYLNDINSFIINYRVIDPSVLGTSDTEFSIQVFSPVNGKGYHIGFGDILRLKRVNAIVRTFRDKRYVNITINTKKNSSIRMWMHKTSKMNVDSPLTTTPSSTTGEGEDTFIKRLQEEAIIVRAGEKTVVSEADALIIKKLASWVETLKPLEIISKSEFRKNLIDAEERQPLDFVVYILKVIGNSELLVCDAESKALIKVTSEVLLLNAFKSENPVGQGNWVKLRSFVKKGDFIVNMEHSSITRLPPLDLPLYKERIEVPRLSKKKRSIQINEWNSTSVLNGHFPRKMIRHNGYVKKMLQFSNHDGNFETVSKPHDRDHSSQEEGEIRA